MKRIKVLTVVGTRPEIIRLSSVIKRLDQETVVDHILVHTGQNYDYELNEIFFKDLGLRKPDYFLNAAEVTAMGTIGAILRSVDLILEQINPDALLVLGDTNSCLSAIAAKKRHIPIFHMEAGNRCFDQRVPEETNRKIVDHIADINMPYSDISREYLISEGIAPDRIIKTGSPMFEVLHDNMKKVEESRILTELDLKESQYFVVSAHREENVDKEQNLLDLKQSLNAVAEIYKMPIIFSTHPRTHKAYEGCFHEFNSAIRFIKPLGFSDYIKLQKKATAVLSDSGTISEEASILGLRALNIRQAHERPEAMEETAVMMVGLKKDRIMQGLEILLKQEGKEINQVSDYITNNVSEKVIRIILSYIDYVNRTVWMKNMD